MKNNNNIHIYLAGDSTCANKPDDKYPETGWGQVLNQFMIDSVVIHNRAKNGRSSKSFIDEGLLAFILETIHEGDFLLIQFGHNDQKEDELRHTDPYSTYIAYLKQYIEGARKKGAYPVLLTSVYRRHFHEDRIKEGVHGNYPEAMITLSKQEGVPLIDICQMTKEWLAKLGDYKSKSYYLHLEKGENENYPEGIKDNTHLSYKGAMVIAEMVAEKLEGIMGHEYFIRN